MFNEEEPVQPIPVIKKKIVPITEPEVKQQKIAEKKLDKLLPTLSYLNEVNQAAGKPETIPIDTNIFADEDLAYIIRTKGLVNSFDDETDIFSKFKRFGTSIMDPFNKMSKAKEYVFFTKPDLNIMVKTSNSVESLNTGLQNITLFNYAEKNYKNVLRQLSYTYDNSFNDIKSSPFSQLISNSMTNTLDVPDLSSSEVDTSANVFGNKITYRGHSYKSDQDGSFSVEVEDNKYLDLFMYYRLYDEYERQKHLGMVSISSDLIFFKIIHDQSSVYKIVVGEDGETIIYWARYIGCFPTGAPRSSMGDLPGSLESGLKYNISYKAQFFSDLDLNILSDFNRLVYSSNVWKLVKSSDYNMPLYDVNAQHSDGNWASIPYIEVEKNTKSNNTNDRYYKFYLRWKKYSID